MSAIVVQIGLYVRTVAVIVRIAVTIIAGPAWVLVRIAGSLYVLAVYYVARFAVVMCVRTVLMILLIYVRGAKMTKKNESKKKQIKSKAGTKKAGSSAKKLPEPVYEKAVTPKLVFSFYAYQKLKHICEKVKTEVGCYGISSPDNVLRVEDIYIPKQAADSMYNDFDVDDVADYMEKMFDEGLQPFQCTRIWIHTHPAGIASPSGTDNDTFARSFGECNFSLMVILPKSGKFYCRIQYKIAEFFHCFEIPVEVDSDSAFNTKIRKGWLDEAEDKITEIKPNIIVSGNNRFGFGGTDGELYDHYEDGGEVSTMRLTSAMRIAKTEIFQEWLWGAYGQVEADLSRKRYDAQNWTIFETVEEYLDICGGVASGGS